jgi:hypothetical protein
LIEHVSEARMDALFPADASGRGVLRVAGPVTVDAAIEAFLFFAVEQFGLAPEQKKIF